MIWYGGNDFEGESGFVNTLTYIGHMSGLDANKPYTFKNGKMTDSDGDPIELRINKPTTAQKKQPPRDKHDKQSILKNTGVSTAHSGERMSIMSNFQICSQKHLCFLGAQLPRVITPTEIMESEPMQRGSECVIQCPPQPQR